MFLEKMKEFEERIIDDAVKNSELWWGEEMDRGNGRVSHTYISVRFIVTLLPMNLFTF